MAEEKTSKLGRILKTITAIATAIAAIVGLIIAVHTATTTFKDKAAAETTDQNKGAIEQIAKDIRTNREEIRSLYREILALHKSRQPTTVSVPRTIRGSGSPSISVTRRSFNFMAPAPAPRPRLTPPEELFKKKARELPQVQAPQLKSYEEIQQQQMKK